MSPGSAETPSARLPILEGPPLPEQVSLSAVEWLVALQAPDAGETTREAFRHWLDAHPDHERAWRHIESFGAQLRELDAPIAHATLTGTSGRPGRRRAIKALAVAAFTGSSAWLARDALRHEWDDWRADHRTATGERRSIMLADSTRVELDTASAIAVRFDDTRRLIRLLHGRILVATAPDPAAGPARPFLVETAEGRLRPLGTRFSVHRQDGGSHLAVVEGAVEIQPALAPGATQIIRAGEQTRFSASLIGTPAPLDPRTTAWTSGMLVARDMRLADFIVELARYRPGRLACDPAAGDLSVSGIYPLDDTDRVLDMLLRTQPIEIHRLTRYWVTLRPQAR